MVIAGVGSDCASRAGKCVLEVQHMLRSQGSVTHPSCAQQRNFDLLFTVLPLLRDTAQSSNFITHHNYGGLTTIILDDGLG